MANHQAKGKPRFLSLPTSRRALLHLGAVGAVTFVLFRYFFLPVWISGSSMEPTYADSRPNFCWRLAYAWHAPARGDVVVVRLAGESIMLLKRVVAVEGETVEFRAGELYVNGVRQSEPYVKNGGNWELPPRTVKPGHVYAVGDNRSMPLDRHKFGHAALDRIIGAPLW